ncbi:MAG: helix-turn-helix domain-containing protein, partial [Bacteroidota bacterium]
ANEREWQRTIENLQAMVFSATGRPNRQAIIEQWLQEILLQPCRQSWESANFISATTKLLEQGFSTQSIATLLGTSRKTLHKSFREHTLKTPGAYQQIYRFRQALRLRQQQRKGSLTGLAYDSGYYDQSHMVRDFRRLSGLTPRGLLTELLDVGDGNVFWLPE